MTNLTFPLDSIKWFGDSTAIRGAAGTESLTLTPGSFTFTGPAWRHVLDYNSVWQPLLANMPGFKGARAVINWFCNSDTPGSPTAWDTLADAGGSTSATTDTLNGSTVGVLQETNAGATNYGPYLYGQNGWWNGAWASQAPTSGTIPSGSIFASRGAIKSVSGATAWNIYQRPRDAQSTTESGNGPITLTTSFQVFSHTFEQCSNYKAFGVRYNPTASAAAVANVAQVQLEDLSGSKETLIPSEYVPSGSTPTWRWFSTARATSRTNPTMVATAAALVSQKDPAQNATCSGVLTDAAGSTLSTLAGLMMEPQAVNLCVGWTAPLNIGTGKTSGAMTGAASGVAGFRSGNTTAYMEASSGMLVDGTDISLTVTTNVVASSTTNFVNAGFNTTDTYWIWTSAAQYGPCTFSSISANSMTASVALATFAAGTAVRIMRIPAASDNIMAQLNDGTWHTTTVNGAVTLPTFNATWSNMGKAPVTITLTAAPSANAGYASSDNGRRVHWWKAAADFGWSIASGTGTFGIVHDRAELVSAGLGYLSPGGLVYRLSGATVGSTVFDFGQNTGGTALRSTNVSIFARIASGAGTPVLQLKAHGSAANITGATYTRQAWTNNSVNTDTRANITIGATTPATVLYVICPQVEQAASGETVVQSSPIQCRGAATTRTNTRATRPWNGTAKNNISRGLTWTPAFGALAQKQSLYYLFADASNYLELSITNTTITWRKRRGGTNFDVTASFTPVDGTAVVLTFGISSSLGVTLTVNGEAATPNTTDLFDIQALTAAATEDIGSSAGATGAYGSFRDLVVS